MHSHLAFLAVSMLSAVCLAGGPPLKPLQTPAQAPVQAPAATLSVPEQPTVATPLLSLPQAQPAYSAAYAAAPVTYAAPMSYAVPVTTYTAVSVPTTTYETVQVPVTSYQTVNVPQTTYATVAAPQTYAAVASAPYALATAGFPLGLGISAPYTTVSLGAAAPGYGLFRHHHRSKSVAKVRL